MREIEKISKALFEKIRDRFEDVSLGDTKAKATQDPAQARIFNFDYITDDVNHGTITISLIDETSLKIYFSKNISHNLNDLERNKWYSFLRELREFAKRNMLSFEPRDITRSTLKHRDLQQATNSDNTVTKDEIAIEESKVLDASRVVSWSQLAAKHAALAKRYRDNGNEERAKEEDANAGYYQSKFDAYNKYREKQVNESKVIDALQIIALSQLAEKHAALAKRYRDNGNEERAKKEDANAGYYQSKFDAYNKYREKQVDEARMYGTAKRSYEKRGPVRIVVQHTKPVVDEAHGARSRNIDAIFIENNQGERFRLPFKNVTGARVMARHVAEGGQTQDDFGKHITEMVTEYAKLRPFLRTAHNRTFEDTETQSMVEAAFEYHALLHDTLNKMKGKKGYNKVKENFVPDTTLMDGFDATALKDRFVKRIFDDRLEEAYPLIFKAHNMKKQNKFAQQFESWANNIVDDGLSDMSNNRDIKLLRELLSEPLTVGVDASNATTALEGLINDDNLYNLLGEIANDNPDEDVSTVIKDWLKQNDPETFNQLDINDEEYNSKLDDYFNKEKEDEDHDYANRLDDEQYGDDELDEGNTYGAGIPGGTENMLAYGLEEDSEGSPLIPEDVIDAWHQVFPHSLATAQKSLGSYTFIFRLAKDRTEVPNNIMNNDPLSYTGVLHSDGTFEEYSGSLLIKPPVGANLVYSLAKLRKKSIKNVTKDKLIRRFKEVHAFIAANANNLKNPKFDVTEKLGNLNTLDEGYPKLSEIDVYKSRVKALQDILLDPDTAKDPEFAKEVRDRRIKLDQEAKQKGILADEDNQYNEALDQMRKIAGLK